MRWPPETSLRWAGDPVVVGVDDACDCRPDVVGNRCAPQGGDRRDALLELGVEMHIGVQPIAAR